MPKVKYRDFLQKLKKTDVFSFGMLESKMGRNYAKIFIHNLRKKGEIEELVKGWYTFKKSPYLVLIPLQKAYIGLGTAAFLLGAWNQVPNIDILTPLASLKVKSGEKTIWKRKVIIRRISEKMYFGYELIKEDEQWIKVSNPEKTLIDLIYFKYPFLNEISSNLTDMINSKKLNKYLEILKKRKVKGWKRISETVKNLKPF